jgi:hypothetical protein
VCVCVCSKFRNIECKPAARDACYDQLHVTTAPVEGNAVAAAVDRWAFAHEIDGTLVLPMGMSCVEADAGGLQAVLRSKSRR